MAILIGGTGKAVPSKKVINDALDKALDTNDDWIRSHTGIGSRYIAQEGETSVSLGVQACKNALQRYSLLNSISPEQIDVIICATATPDYSGFPSNACIIQKHLGAVNAACFDLSAACSGFIYALDTAASLMERHSWKYGLVVGTEVLSKVLDWTDRSTCVLFGDGSGAVLLENTFSPGGVGIGSVELGSDGTGDGELYIDENQHIRMNGRAVYNFAVKVITETVQKLLEKEHLHIDDIDLIVCHQANQRILAAAAKRLGFDFAKFVCNMEEYGNTSAASIPITLTDLVEQGKLRKGMTIITAGFGAGLTWGGCIIRF